MAPEYIAVTVSVSVLGGIIVIALVVVCIVKLAYDNDLEDTMAKQGEFMNTMELQEARENPSYVHYPEPEPYTPTHAPEEDPWRMNHIETSLHNQGPPHDTQDDDMLDYDPFRQPSIHQPYTGSADGALDMPRRPSYEQGLQRRQLNVEEMQRRASRAGDIEINRGRRISMLQNGRPPVASQMSKLPTRRGSLQPNSGPPNGNKNKLWYFYLTEEPDYFSRDALERNKKRGRRLSREMQDMPNSSASVHRPMRQNSFTPPHPNTQPPPRRQSFSYTQPQPYPPNPDPRTQWI